MNISVHTLRGYHKKRGMVVGKASAVDVIYRGTALQDWGGQRPQSQAAERVYRLWL